MGTDAGAGAENLIVGDKRGDAPSDLSDGSRELRMGMEVFSGANISDFKCDAPIQSVRSLGSSYTVSYADEYASLFGPLVRESIDQVRSKTLPWKRAYIRRRLRSEVQAHAASAGGIADSVCSATPTMVVHHGVACFRPQAKQLGMTRE